MLDASGIIHLREQLFLVAEDETDQIRLFEFSPGERRFADTGRMLDFGKQESDLESLAWDPDSRHFFSIGSHSADYSEKLLQFRIEGHAPADSRFIPFEANELVEGDVDIEALSVMQGKLLVGYRSPILGKRAVAVLFDPHTGEQMMTTFDLGGRVFRDMVRVDDDNYLILGGPRRGGDYTRQPSRLYWWNGRFFGRSLCECAIRLDDFRAEGLACRRTPAGSLDILLGSDESKVRNADRFRMLHVQVRDVRELCSTSVQPIELQVLIQ